MQGLHSYLKASARGREVVIHFCYTRWQVFLVPDMMLDLRHSDPLGWVRH